MRRLLEECGRLRNKIYYRGISSPALWCRRSGYIAFLLAFAAFIFFRLGTVSLTFAFYVMCLSAIVAIISLLLGIIGARQVWTRGDIGAYAVANGVFASLIVLVPFIYFAFLWYLSPAINDLSTDTQQPPLMSRSIATIDKADFGVANADADLQLMVYPELIGRRIAMPSEQAIKVVRETMSEHGWKNIQEMSYEEGSIFRARAKNPILGLQYDVAVRVYEDDGDSYIDMRMISHYGDKELGFSAVAIASFMQELDVKLRDELLSSNAIAQ